MMVLPTCALFSLGRRVALVMGKGALEWPGTALRAEIFDLRGRLMGSWTRTGGEALLRLELPGVEGIYQARFF